MDPRKSKNKVTLELRDQEGISGNIFLSLKYYEYDTPELEGIMNDYEVFDPLNTVKLMLHRANTKSIGKALKIVGYKPKYPVIIVPGLASSALEAWESPKESWIRERVWIDPFKIGKTALSMRLSRLTSSKKKPKRKNSIPTSISEDSFATSPQTEPVNANADQRIWLQHIMLASDGFSDPPGIKLRAVDGLTGCDYLSTNLFAKKASYVMSYIINELVMVGYSPTNLDAATVSIKR